MESSIIKNIQEYLFSVQDTTYQQFQSKIIPNVNQDTIIGVRTPILRDYAKKLAKDENIEEFFTSLPHKYFEENLLHAFILERLKDYDRAIETIDIFLPYVDNWATCDMMSPKIFKKHSSELYKKIDEWLQSDHTYTIRFGIGMLMSFFLDEHFKPEILEKVAAIKSEEYYVNMMIAWFFATALAKQEKATLPYITEKRLDTWTHNKAIQKAIESYRINDEMKEYLKRLKIKK